MSSAQLDKLKRLAKERGVTWLPDTAKRAARAFVASRLVTFGSVVVICATVAFVAYLWLGQPGECP